MIHTSEIKVNVFIFKFICTDFYKSPNHNSDRSETQNGVRDRTEDRAKGNRYIVEKKIKKILRIELKVFYRY